MLRNGGQHATSANSSMAIGGWLQRKSEKPQMYKKKGRKERKSPNSEEQASYMAEAVQAAEISGRDKCIMSLRG